LALKIHKVEDNHYAFHCPGCGHAHAVTVNGKKNGSNASWEWNGSMDKPTFTPSLNVVGYCHSFVRDGNIQFLSDCTHKLAGQTVEIPDWDD
jgi:hypothetical protein